MASWATLRRWPILQWSRILSPIASPERRIALLTALLLSGCSGKAPRFNDLDLYDQVGCFADLAVSRQDIDVCSTAANDGVRNQCYAVAASGLDRLDACNRIEPHSTEHIELRDACISDIALLRHNATLCRQLDSRTLQDSCLFKIYEGTGDTKLCADIADRGLRRLCDETPVFVK